MSADQLCQSTHLADLAVYSTAIASPLAQFDFPAIEVSSPVVLGLCGALGLLGLVLSRRR